jgi:hypothetical protein
MTSEIENKYQTYIRYTPYAQFSALCSHLLVDSDAKSTHFPEYSSECLDLPLALGV